MRPLLLLSLAIGLSGALAGWTSATAVAQAPFYQGKQLSIIVNFPPGGPSDNEGRLVARHIAKHLTGNPAVVVKNMPGEGGAHGANWLAQTAAPDGLSLGYFSGTAARAALGDPALSAEVAKLAFIAAGSGIAVTFARADIGGGIKQPADLIKRKEFWLGGLAADNDRDVRARMQLDLLGIKYQYVSGYPAVADARFAFQRGDIQVLIDSLAAYRSSIEPGPVQNGVALPLWFDPLDDGETFVRPPDTEDIPALTFTDFLIKVQGELPKSRLFDAYRMVNQVGTGYLRILAMAPGTPREAVAAVRQAVEKLGEDPEFREDSQKTLKLILRLNGGERTAERFRKLLSPEPEMRAFLRAYIEKGKANPPAGVPAKAPANPPTNAPSGAPAAPPAGAPAKKAQ